jgi:hypothetical protein
MDDRRLLDEQIEYYRARAEEYDEWWFRKGRYDRGEEQRQAWFAEVAQVEAALRQAGPGGALGWTGYVLTSGRFFLYGCLHP